MTKEEFLKTIKGKMIISCQAVKGEPLYVEEKINHVSNGKSCETSWC